MTGNRLQGKRALVTGAGGGIGGAISRHFARQGSAVAVADIDVEAAERTVAEITAEGGRAIAVSLDVSDPARAEAAVAAAVQAFGGLEVLANVAAGPSPRGTVETMAVEDFAREITVNLTGYFLMAKYAIPRIREAGGGSIINIASQLGQIGVPMRPAYCSSKAAIINLTRVMAIDHAPDNIRVNSISPGAIDTPRTRKHYAAGSDTPTTRGRYYLRGAVGQVDEIAWGAVFLASDESSFMTGSDLLIDGGFLAFKGSIEDLGWENRRQGSRKDG